MMNRLRKSLGIRKGIYHSFTFISLFYNISQSTSFGEENADECPVTCSSRRTSLQLYPQSTKVVSFLENTALF